MQKIASYFSTYLKHLFFISILFSSSKVFAEIPIPELINRVNDLSGILDSNQEEALEYKLKSLENKKGAQVARSHLQKKEILKNR